MRKLIIILFASLLSLPALSDDMNLRKDNKLRDSLINVLEAMPHDTLRCKKGVNLYYQYTGFDFSELFLKDALEVSREIKSELHQLLTYYAYVDYYDDMDDNINMYSAFESTKRLALKLKKYKLYFRSWNDVVIKYLNSGEFERVAIEGEKMKKEAERLDFPEGVLTANITMASMYKMTKNYNEAAALYKEIIDNPDASFVSKQTAVLNMATVYFIQRKFEEGLKYVDYGKKYLDQTIIKSGTPRMQNRKNILNIELLYCNAYLAIPNPQKLKEHIDSARCYMPEVLSDRDFILYHSHLASYHSLNSDMDQAMRELDTAMERAKEYSTQQYLNFYNWKASYYLQMKDTLSSLKMLDQLVVKEDSLYAEIINIQKECIEENYLMEKSIQRTESIKVIIGYMGVCSIAIIIFALMLFNIRSAILYFKSKKNLREARAAYETADKANKLKDSFVKNVSFEIRTYINEVVGYSELISDVTSYSETEKKNFIMHISESATNLMTLIINVLNLSRLEAGMMKYQIVKADILSLCTECHIPYKTDLNRMVRKIDKNRIIEVIRTSMSQESEVSINSYGKKALIIITHSPLAIRTDRSAGITQSDILTDINTLLIRHFHGKYSIDADIKTVSIIL